jgi:hypothetical protein
MRVTSSRRTSIRNHQSSITNHSHLSATIGSTFAARRAGTSMAKQATDTNTMGTVMSVKIYERGGSNPMKNNQLLFDKSMNPFRPTRI